MELNHSLLSDDVHVGDQLPPLAVELSATLIISAAIASRDFADIHHDREAAQARGLRDIIMNIETTTGYLGRYVTDWGGPNTVLRHLTLRLGVPNYPHDTMTLTGTVTAIQMEDDCGVVEVDVKGTNSLGEHVVGKVLAALPRAGRDPARRDQLGPRKERESVVSEAASEPRAAPTAEGDDLERLTESLRALVGRESDLVPAPETVSEVVIRQFVEAIDDRNPVYADAALAGRSVHRGLVAPPGMLQAWTLNSRRCGEVFAQAPSFELAQRLRRAGFTSMIATNCEQHYMRYLRPGDSLRLRNQITGIVGPKTTSLGLGFFVTIRISLVDQAGETVGWHEGRTLRYRPGGRTHGDR